MDKKNCKGGHPSKLSYQDKQSILYQITTGQVDNAVQATNFINNIIPNPVTPQTVRNVLKENKFHSIVKKKCPLLKQWHWIAYLKFAKYHENWTVKDWKWVLWSDKTKINRIGSDGVKIMDAWVKELSWSLHLGLFWAPLLYLQSQVH